MVLTMLRNQWGLSPSINRCKSSEWSSVEPQLWVKCCATAMGLGTAVGGWKIIKL